MKDWFKLILGNLLLFTALHIMFGLAIALKVVGVVVAVGVGLYFIGSIGK